MPALISKRLRLYKWLATMQVVFACIILANEWMSITNRVPGGNFPFEHQASWERVILFGCSAVFCLVVSWLFNARKEFIHFLPSFKVTALLSTLPILFGAGLFHYLSWFGWCCETPYAFYFGFPFSFIIGLAGFDPVIKQFADSTVFEVMFNSAIRTTWEFPFYPFFLNFLFWANIIFVLPNIFALPFQIRKIIQSSKEQVIG